MQIIRRAFILACTIILASCGGNSSAPTPLTQSKQLQRGDKTQASASPYQDVVEQLYVAYYGRPADPAGLTYWEGALQAANAPTTIAGLNTAYSTPAVKAIVDSFGNSAESQALYGSGNASGFIGAIYQNVLGRAPDNAGGTYWSGLVSSGSMTQAQAALAILSAAAAEPTSSSDEQIVANRLTVADYFTAQIAAQGLTQNYSGMSANAQVRTMLATVTANTDTTTFQQAARATIFSLPAMTAITSCQEITVSGNYALVNDIAPAISSTKPACIYIHDVSHVTLDCGDHQFSGQPTSHAFSSPLEISNADHVSISNCRLLAAGPLPSSFFNSDTISFTHNILSYAPGIVVSYIYAKNITNALLDSNTITGTYEEYDSTNDTISNNHFTSLSGPGINQAALVVIVNAINTKVIGNTLDGSWDHVQHPLSALSGSDDGIGIDNGVNLTIQNNVISNVFDCGIEWVDTLVNSTISGNTISYAANCGVGAWDSDNLIGATIANNTVKNAGSLFTFYRGGGLNPDGNNATWAPLQPFGVSTNVVFQNNVFDGNVFTNDGSMPMMWSGTGVFFYIYSYLDYPFGSPGAGATDPPRANFQLTNNVFKNNQFGHGNHPDFGSGIVVPGYIIDGGNNQCTPPDPAAYPNYPLTCH